MESHDSFKCPQCGSDQIIEIETTDLDLENNGIETETEYSYECTSCGCKFN